VVITVLKTLIKTGSALTVFVLLATAIALYMAPEPLLKPTTPNSQAYYSSDGELLRLTLSADEQYRLWVDLADIPHDFQQATLLYEDQYFYSHYGVNVFSLIRAAFSSYVGGGRRMGASTITMQLARLRSGLNTTSIPGKLNQIWQAMVLERHYSKKQILEAYLNHAPYGHNIQGIAAASLCYFHKRPINLTTAESLLLAVVPQNPNKRAPSTTSGMAAASAARERLIESWLKKSQLTGIDKTNLSVPLKIHPPKNLPFIAPHFVEQLIKEKYVRNPKSNPRHNKADTTDLANSVSSNPNIHTSTLSLSLQKHVEKVTQNYIKDNRVHGLSNASVMVIDYTDMSIQAEVGSVDYFDKRIAGQVNGTRALRSPGSTLKPFIYALGLEQGLIHPSSLLKDTPQRFSAYTPENYDTTFVGPISARDALIRSRNIPAVSLMKELNNPSLHQWLKQTKPRRLQNEAHYGLALALGGSEVSMVELLQWYATLANHGHYRKAKNIASSQHGNNKPAKHIDDLKTDQPILTPEASFLTLEMLSKNPDPRQMLISKALSTATNPRQSIPWKTGTSFAFRDAWSIGVVGQYVVGVWVGNFDGRANPALIGRSAAGPLFFKISDHLQQSRKGQNNYWRNTADLNIKQIDVCKTSGDLDIDHCPNVVKDWFIPGVSPFKSQQVFREIPIDIESGLRACQPNAANTRTVVFEFWPSDVEQIFRSAGIIKKKPPPFMPECNKEQYANSEDAPTITSPIPNLTYALQSDSLGRDEIPLTATASSDANALYWFVNNQFIGQTKPQHPVLWKAKQGTFQVTVVDDIGRTSQTSILTQLVN